MRTKARFPNWHAAAATLLLATMFAAAGCGPNQRIVNSSEERSMPEAPSNLPPPEPPSLESDLESMRTAEFEHIYVFRRKDGGVMTAEDRVFVNEHTPLETNRRKISDGGRVIILGTNFKFPEENMKALTERFAFDDQSPPSSGKPEQTDQQ